MMILKPCFEGFKLLCQNFKC